jgi:protein ImuB
LIELVSMQLERLRLNGAMTRGWAAVLLSAPLEQRQFQLFESSARERPQELARLVNRLSNRLGEQAVVRPQLQAGALPERAYRYSVLTGQPRARRQPTGKSPLRPLQRPLQLESAPVALHAVSVAHDGAPALFQYQNQNHRIAHWWGPERIETHWWRGKLIQRDYYRVETTSGVRFWLFRCLQDHKWFLHGKFA